MTRLALELQRAMKAEDIPPKSDFERWAKAALAGRMARAELVIRVVDEPESQALNLGYRGKEKPTNVLSFPFEAPSVVKTDLIGDLVLCHPVVVREANEQHKPLEHHYAHLVVHGVLHLLGYDHQDDAEAEEMEAEERHILNTLDIEDPYRMDDNDD